MEKADVQAADEEASVGIRAKQADCVRLVLIA